MNIVFTLFAIPVYSIIFISLLHFTNFVFNIYVAQHSIVIVNSVQCTKSSHIVNIAVHQVNNIRNDITNKKTFI